jgi:CPA1 family monovalent cation:H+ antiporter
VRGIVSLAAALAIPLVTERGQPFPHRDLILILTFAVILVTLVGQGLLLRTVMRALGLANAGRREHAAERRQEYAARRKAIEAAEQRLEALRRERDLPPDLVHALRSRLADRLKYVGNKSDGDSDHEKLGRLDDDIKLQLLSAERDTVNELYRGGALHAEPRRRIERELDLRDAQLEGLTDDE